MSFRLAGTGGNCNGCQWTAAQGEITSDTPRLFREYLRERGQVHFVVLNSPGGDLLAGLELGELIRSSGATTGVGKTVQLQGEGVSHLEEIKPGICASSCSFAFMGGVERAVNDGSRLGVHQFYTTNGNEISSTDTQTLAGLTLFHTIRLGIDPRVIVAASGTSPEQIFWFNDQELSEYGLDTSKDRTDPWRLEPYKNGMVLTTRHHDSVRRSVAITMFCRYENQRWQVLISEENAHSAKQMKAGKFFNFQNEYPSRPTLSVGATRYRVQPENVEFQRISGNTVMVSIDLPANILRSGETKLEFDPDFARVFGSLLSFDVQLPSNDWLKVTGENCI